MLRKGRKNLSFSLIFKGIVDIYVGVCYNMGSDEFVYNGKYLNNINKYYTAKKEAINGSEA